MERIEGSEGLQERWHRCKATIGQQIGTEDSATWLAGLELQELNPRRIVLGGIPNTFFRNRIVSRFRPLIVDSLRSAFPDVFPANGDELQLDLQIGLAQGNSRSSDAALLHGMPARATVPAGPSTPAKPPSVLSESRYSFGSFLEAPGNASALNFARDVAAAPGERYNPLVLVGDSGLGKTHLMRAIAEVLNAESGGDDASPTPPAARYVTGEAFKNEVLEGITRKRMAEFRERYRSAQALLVDDLEFLLVSPKAQEELLHTFDVLHRSGRQLVFSIDRMPRRLTGLHDSLRSRLEMGLICELAPADRNTRVALVQQRAAAQGLRVPESVAVLLAERITHDLRRLEGAVVRLSAYAALNGQDITEAFAERFATPFFDTQPGAPATPISPDGVLEQVADRFGLTVRGMKGRGRTPKLAGARRVAVHLLKTLGDCSYSEIGALLGNRSHSTMVHAHQTLRLDLSRDPQLEALIQQLARQLADRQG